MVVPFGSNTARATFLEIFPSVSFFQDNDEATGAASLKEQDPLFQFESHLSHNFHPKFWMSADLRYFGRRRDDDRRHQRRQPDRRDRRRRLGRLRVRAKFLSVQASYGRRFDTGDQKDRTCSASKLAVRAFQVAYSVLHGSRASAVTQAERVT